MEWLYLLFRVGVRMKIRDKATKRTSATLEPWFRKTRQSTSDATNGVQTHPCRYIAVWRLGFPAGSCNLLLDFNTYLLLRQASTHSLFKSSKPSTVPSTVTATFEFFIIKETVQNGRFPARTLNLQTEVHVNWLCRFWFAW